LNGLLNVQRAYHAVFCSRYRQVDKWRMSGYGGQVFSGRGSVTAFGAPAGGFVRVATKAAILNSFYVGKSSASARAAVDLAVPLSPRIKTPPIRGSTAFKTRRAACVPGLRWL
jgi:hypothetical protein